MIDASYGFPTYVYYFVSISIVVADSTKVFFTYGVWLWVFALPISFDGCCNDMVGITVAVAVKFPMGVYSRVVAEIFVGNVWLVI